MSTEESIAFCENLFAKYLDGHELMSNANHLRGSAQWFKFPRVVCKTWVHHNGRVPVVLMGDAAHTAHFSIGSGTKLALEDAIELADCLQAASGKAKGDMLDVLKAYEQTRSVEVLKIQNAARNSTHWFENVKRYTAFRGGAVRLQPAHPLAAHLPRESAPARQEVRGRRRDRGWRRRAASTAGPWRRCLRRSACAA